MTPTAAPARRLDVAAIRRDFPILERKIHGKPLAYLDNTATTQKPASVLKALDDFYRLHNANPHRGVYLLGEEATAAYEQAREKVARFVNARSARDVVFTRGTTESVNLVASAWGRLKFTDQVTPKQFEALVTEAQSVGFLRNAIPLDRLFSARP